MNDYLKAAYGRYKEPKGSSDLIAPISPTDAAIIEQLQKLSIAIKEKGLTNILNKYKFLKDVEILSLMKAYVKSRQNEMNRGIERKAPDNVGTKDRSTRRNMIEFTGMYLDVDFITNVKKVDEVAFDGNISYKIVMNQDLSNKAPYANTYFSYANEENRDGYFQVIKEKLQLYDVNFI